MTRISFGTCRIEVKSSAQQYMLSMIIHIWFCLSIYWEHEGKIYLKINKTGGSKI